MKRISYYDATGGYFDNTGGYFVDDVRAVNHGDPHPIDLRVFLGPDPELALVTADMHVWLAAHPCECEALCECEKEGER